MGKKLSASQDENGYFTLELPQPGWWNHAFPQLPDRRKLLKQLRRIAKQRLVIYTAAAVGGIWLAFSLLFFIPSSLAFSVADGACGFNPMLLPRLSKHSASPSFAPEPSTSLSVAGYPLLSFKTCLSAIEAPVPGQTETAKISLLHVPFLQKRIKITPAELPSASAKFNTSQAVSATGTLEFNLSHKDTVFAYRLSTADKSVGCASNSTLVSCDLKPLELSQGADHQLKLERYFAEQPSGEALALSIRTLDPVIINSSSIAAGATVYDSPTEITLVANKQLAEAGIVSLVDPGGGTVGATASINKDSVVVKLETALARNQKYSLKIEQLTATDGSQLTGPYQLDFVTSGGPKVSAASIGGSRVQPGASITLTFDIGLKANQEWGNFAHIEVGGQAVAASISATGRQLTINPSADLPRCASFKVIINEGLVNEYGIGGGQAWHLDSRVLCQVAFSIGSSVRGRAITAYRFGSGSSKIVFVGGMHGNEKSSVATMNAFIAHLEDHASEIPAHRTIIIIPNSNPDGYAVGSRTNANNVDLNRNFPANDWQAEVQMPGGQNLPQGGGNSPGDQPETQALMSYINSQSPRLVLTYHAVARVVISNDAGDSVSLGSKYGSDSGYRFTTDGGSDAEFGYSTTGEFEDWLADKKNIPAILVELSSMSANQFSTHRTALMNVVQIP